MQPWTTDARNNAKITKSSKKASPFTEVSKSLWISTLHGESLPNRDSPKFHPSVFSQGGNNDSTTSSSGGKRRLNDIISRKTTTTQRHHQVKLGESLQDRDSPCIWLTFNTLTHKVNGEAFFGKNHYFARSPPLSIVIGRDALHVPTQCPTRAGI